MCQTCPTPLLSDWFLYALNTNTNWNRNQLPQWNSIMQWRLQERKQVLLQISFCMNLVTRNLTVTLCRYVVVLVEIDLGEAEIELFAYLCFILHYLHSTKCVDGSCNRSSTRGNSTKQPTLFLLSFNFPC